MLLKRLRVHGYLLQQLAKKNGLKENLDEVTKVQDKRESKQSAIYISQQQQKETRESSWNHLQGLPTSNDLETAMDQTSSAREFELSAAVNQSARGNRGPIGKRKTERGGGRSATNIEEEW